MGISKVNIENNKMELNRNRLKKYMIVKDHVREIISEEGSDSEKSMISSQSTKEEVHRKRSFAEALEFGLADTLTKTVEQIDKSDLEELRTVYKKCKTVLKNIEAKYGHLLRTSEPDCSNSFVDNQNYNKTRETEIKCTCMLGKKVIFDESGNQISVDRIQDHICPRTTTNHRHETAQNIEIEYTELDSNDLSNDIVELGMILRNPDIDVSYRERIIQKIKHIKQDSAFEIKNCKPSLIEQLKSNPDEVFEFTGSNLNTITGYL